MKIYIIENHADYEGFSIVKVFRSKVRALKFMKDLADEMEATLSEEKWGWKIYFYSSKWEVKEAVGNKFGFHPADEIHMMEWEAS